MAHGAIHDRAARPGDARRCVFFLLPAPDSRARVAAQNRSCIQTEQFGCVHCMWSGPILRQPSAVCAPSSPPTGVRSRRSAISPPPDYRTRFDPVAARPIDALPGMVGLEFQVQDLDRCAAELRGRNVHFRRAADELHVHSEQLGHVIVFSA